MGAKYPPITGAKLALFTIGVSLAIFMNVLDTSIANVAIPTIAGDLAVSANEGTWIITSFAVSLAIALPLTGWLGKRFGEVRLFVWATLLFTLFSLLCGLAVSLPMLIVLRVLQGAVAGPMIPLSQSLLLMNYPEEKHGTALSIWSMTAVVAPVAGPILGGWITDSYSWPWIFYINVPVGLVSAWITASVLRGRETDTERKRIDTVGLALLIVGVACLQVLLDKGNELAWFSSPMIWWLAVISTVALSFFIAWELTEPEPVVDLTLFRQRNFTVGAVALSLGYLTFFGSVVIFPLWLQTQMGYTATWAGVAAAPIGVLAIVVSPWLGTLMRRFDLRVLVTISFVLFAGVSFWVARYTTDVSLSQLMLPRLIFGIGMPLFFVPLIAMSLSGLPPQRIASASGLANFLRMLGGGFGASISISIWDQRQALHDTQLTAAASTPDLFNHAFFGQLGELGLGAQASAVQLAHLISRQAFMLATNDFFWLSGWLFLALMVLVWAAKGPFGRTAGASGGH
jgi:DHA2 family multidrug resistance protein